MLSRYAADQLQISSRFLWICAKYGKVPMPMANNGPVYSRVIPASTLWVLWYRIKDILHILKTEFFQKVPYALMVTVPMVVSAVPPEMFSPWLRIYVLVLHCRQHHFPWFVIL
jgi:hypothetical protein